MHRLTLRPLLVARRYCSDGAPSQVRGYIPPTFELLARQYHACHRAALGMVGELSQEQFRWRPTHGPQSIGWNLWHIARWNDYLAEVLLQQTASLSHLGPARQVWKEPEAFPTHDPYGVTVLEMFRHAGEHLGTMQALKGMFGLRGSSPTSLPLSLAGGGPKLIQREPDRRHQWSVNRACVAIGTFAASANPVYLMCAANEPSK
jgi:DinB family protein